MDDTLRERKILFNLRLERGADDGPRWEKMIGRLDEAEEVILVSSLIAWQRERAGRNISSSSGPLLPPLPSRMRI